MFFFSFVIIKYNIILIKILYVDFFQHDISYIYIFDEMSKFVDVSKKFTFVPGTRNSKSCGNDFDFRLVLVVSVTY